MSARSLNRVDRLLTNRVTEAREVVGAVVLVRDPEGVVFHEAYGLRQRIPSEKAMTKRTVFDLASLTKPVCTSLLAMIMTDRGRLSPDERLATWFGPLKDPEKGEITVRQLLSNRSGLPAWRPYYQEYPRGPKPVDQEEIVGRILAEPLEGPPGEKEIYSDLGFILLGSILEKVSGLSLDQLFRAEIAMPLGLRDTGYRRISDLQAHPERTDEPIAATENCAWRGRVLVGEVHDENCCLLGGVAGHAGLFSTAADLDRVVAELFEGSHGRSDLFSPLSMSTFFHRQAPPGQGTWALGWDTPSERDSASGHYYSKNSFGHNGFTGTSLWVDFDRHVSVVFLTNRVHPTRENGAIRGLRPQVHDAVFEEVLLVRNDHFSGSG
jgi:CubicO group peptidase (beta-lactamase class C family)